VLLNTNFKNCTRFLKSRASQMFLSHFFLHRRCTFFFMTSLELLFFCEYRMPKLVSFFSSEHDPSIHFRLLRSGTRKKRGQFFWRPSRCAEFAKLWRFIHKIRRKPLHTWIFRVGKSCWGTCLSFFSFVLLFAFSCSSYPITLWSIPLDIFLGKQSSTGSCLCLN